MTLYNELLMWHYVSLACVFVVAYSIGHAIGACRADGTFGKTQDPGQGGEQ